AGAAPGGFRGRPGGGGGGGGGRPGQRGGAAGAFGRPGGAPPRGRKSKRQKRQEYDSMQAPVVGGVRLPHGNAETIRLARGASLSDFAEKIDANPAALVQALFNLGEMVTATQSVGDETLELLGGEMNYNVQVVSPEDEDRELLESFDLSYGEDEGDEADLQNRPPGVTATTARHDCWTPSARPPCASARPAASRSTLAHTRCRLTWMGPTAPSPSSTPRAMRRSPRCVPAARRPPTLRSSWLPPTTA